MADQRLNGELGRLTGWVYKELNKDRSRIEDSHGKYSGLHWSMAFQ